MVEHKGVSILCLDYKMTSGLDGGISRIDRHKWRYGRWVCVGTFLPERLRGLHIVEVNEPRDEHDPDLLSLPCFRLLYLKRRFSLVVRTATALVVPCSRAHVRS
jgi:hypothetical protein